MSGIVGEFNQLASDSVMRRLFHNCSAPGDETADACVVLNLKNKSLANYTSVRQLEKLRYYRRRLARAGNFTISDSTGKLVAPAMEALFALHEARWRARGGTGMLADPNLQSFHRQVAQSFGNAGLLRLYTLNISSSTIAVLYAFADARRVYFYLHGFDPRYEKFSPGCS